MCKLIKVVVSDDGQRREVIKSALTIEKAMAMRDLKQAKQDRLDMQEGTRSVVSYIVEGTVS